MISNQNQLFEKLAEAFINSAVYVSISDDTGGDVSRRKEIASISHLLKVIEEQSSEDSFLFQLSTNAREYTEKSLDEIERNSLKAPSDVKEAVSLAVENFSKKDAQVYTNMIILASASVAQAFDEKDDFTIVGSGVFTNILRTLWLPYLMNNHKQIFARIMMAINSIGESKNSRHLYVENDLFDHIKFSAKEDIALGDITSSIKEIWLKKYPEDEHQTVEEYLREQEEQY